MQSRLPLIAPKLAARMSTATPPQRAALARDVVLTVATRLSLDRDPHVGPALSAVQTGQSCPDVDLVQARAAQLDADAFDAADRLDDGTGTENAYDQGFHRARAATAVVELCAGFVGDACYEALQACDNTLFHQLTDPDSPESGQQEPTPVTGQ